MDAAALLLALHGQLLRLISDAHGAHFEGLGQCARSKRFSGGTSRRLRQLDHAAAWIRHVTGPRCSTFLAEIHRELALSEAAPATAVGSGVVYFIGDLLVEEATQTDAHMGNLQFLDSEALATMVRGLRDGLGSNNDMVNGGLVNGGLVNNDGLGTFSDSLVSNGLDTNDGLVSNGLVNIGLGTNGGLVFIDGLVNLDGLGTNDGLVNIGLGTNDGLVSDGLVNIGLGTNDGLVSDGLASDGLVSDGLGTYSDGGGLVAGSGDGASSRFRW
jgi:hypothetical protein